MRRALRWVFRQRRGRMLLCVWAALFLLFLGGQLVAWSNGWRYRTFVYWLAFLLLFAGPSAALYLRVGRYDDERGGGDRRVAFAALATVFGISLFLAMSALLPVQEGTSEDGYVAVTWAGEGILNESYKTYAKAEYLFFMKDVVLEDAYRRNFRVNPFFFLP